MGKESFSPSYDVRGFKHSPLSVTVKETRGFQGSENLPLTSDSKGILDCLPLSECLLSWKRGENLQFIAPVKKRKELCFDEKGRNVRSLWYWTVQSGWDNKRQTERIKRQVVPLSKQSQTSWSNPATENDENIPLSLDLFLIFRKYTENVCMGCVPLPTHLVSLSSKSVSHLWHRKVRKERFQKE